MDADSFDDLMKRADPARSVADERTEPELLHDLQKISGAPEAASPSRGRTAWPWILVPGVAVLVIVLAVVIQSWNPMRAGGAFAATPPLLTFTQSPLSPREVLERAMSQLQANVDSTAVRHAELEGWYLQTDVDESGASRSVITPEEQRIDWNDDLSGSILATAGRTYVPQGDETVPPSGEVPAEGTVLRDESFGPGEMPILFSTPPPAGTDEMARYLAQVAGLDANADAMDYLDAVRILLSEWTLSPAQESAVLDVILAQPDLSTEGVVTDRLGRPGIGLRVVSENSPYFASILIISTETGRILALETVYLGGLDELNVPPQSVIDYTAWK